MTATRDLTVSEREWLRVRDYLREQRPGLSAEAVAGYAEMPKVAGTTLLTTSTWMPEQPIPLHDLDIVYEPERTQHRIAAGMRASGLPNRPDGSRYERYSQAISELAAPAVFENRATYRLIDADLTGPRGHLVFGRGNYFDGIDTGEAAAHEFAANRLGQIESTNLRNAVDDPCDASRRPVNMAITTLTVRQDRRVGDSMFYLHWRDPAKVGHAGGMYQVVPVGVFQPSAAGPANESNDFSLWHNMLREFAEELAGEPEIGEPGRPVDYANWEFAARMYEGLRSGRVSVYCFGLGVDPLTFATDLLTMTVIESELFDALFGTNIIGNAEGTLSAVPATDEETLLPARSTRSMQAAGEATLRLGLYNSGLYK